MSPASGASEPAGPSFAATVAALAIGQLLCWAALYYTFSSFVLPIMHELGWSKPLLMGAFTAGFGHDAVDQFLAPGPRSASCRRWRSRSAPV